MNKIIPTSYSTERLLLNKNKLENQFDVLLSIIDDGIICINHDGIVQFYSHIARKILGINDNDMIGEFIGNYIKDINFIDILENKNQIYGKLVKVNNVDINIEIKYVQINIFDGFIIKITKFYQAEKKQAKLRAQLVRSGNVSRYTFDDIVGCSKEIRDTKNLASKMARSNSSILIMGESGTGKELFAQSIHSASSKNFGPFVAVNCSTFQENLLQSELFGYDDGAFTGAKKGGKIGLFELANNGTIFLDEIGEMDLNSQAKLLRVIQEKQIRRIGSDKVIDIDVRIIAATNRDLKTLVHENKFRKDLYFRLNVLPLKIKPLRERTDDIFLILDSLKKDLNCDFKLCDDIKEIFKTYSWEGNVRELRNIAEYCFYLDKDIIEICDLPEYILDSVNRDKCNLIPLNDTINSLDYIAVSYNFKRPLSEYLFILGQLNDAYNLKQRIGRRKLHEVALASGIFLTEQQIRSILLELQTFGFVTVLTGRGGSVITNSGIVFLKNNH
jgi:transcriptional regulator with PAS, ATPase and Fis domain